jgi:hypothetical protein
MAVEHVLAVLIVMVYIACSPASATDRRRELAFGPAMDSAQPTMAFT